MSRHSSTFALRVRSSSQVCATFNTGPLSLMAFRMASMFISIWKISCSVWSEKETHRLKKYILK